MNSKAKEEEERFNRIWKKDIMTAGAPINNNKHYFRRQKVAHSPKKVHNY